MILVTEAPSQAANAAKTGDDFTVTGHTQGVRVLCKHVNVESVRVPCEKPYVSKEQTTGQKLRRLTERAGLSMRAFAGAAGFAHASGVQRYFDPEFDGSIKPSVVAQFAAVLVGQGNPPITEIEVTSLAGLKMPDPIESNAIPFKMEGASDDRMRNDLPVYGSALGAAMVIDGEAIEQTTLNKAEVVQYAKRPVILNGRADAYGLYVAGSSMYPAHPDGGIILVDPKRPARIGDDVVVYLRPDNPEDDDGETARAALVKRLVRRTAEYLELEQFTPAKVFRIARSDVVYEHRVIPWSELLS